MSACDETGEAEDLLNVIFSGSCPECWKDNPDTVLYLSELSSYGLQSLSEEPEKLAEEKASILEQTQDLAFHNYKTFIQTAECSQEIFQDFSIIEKRLDDLLATLPNFVKKCDTFTQEALQINNRWHQISLTLSKHPQLLEVLEMPQLMDTCVRNGYYEEALELATYVRRFEKKHSSIPLIASIVKDIQDSMQLMLTQLLQQLRSNIQLPTCLKVIGYLRRMDVFSERELRIKFLQTRDSWFQNVLHSLPKTDPYLHITKTIEASRVHLFDIVTQYRAIFSDDDPLLIPGKDAKNESSIFHSWISLKISEFLKTLEHDISEDLGGRLDSILSQAMYFGLSFSRVGADFRPLLIPIFQNTVLKQFEKSMERAAKQFKQAMQTFTLTSYSFSSAAALSATLANEDNLQPPLSLLEFQPLAHYCNDILTAFNDIRLCAPLTISSDLTSLLENSLSQVVSSIIDFHMAEQTAFTKAEEETFSQFCVQFANELLPYLNKCLLILFPPSELAKILGITMTDFNKLVTKTLIYLNGK
ncbi:conserved oligomeric Golgi complex subunit 8 isoform X2 [Centruroides vittatus]|uniref:conserved oligomeric Golgi complex subunit 8 isoform X2 n=1 Tax=Centruroides vittatus TaxID=120091 RepID=UPI00350EE6E2